MTSQNYVQLLTPFWKRACTRVANSSVADLWFTDKICTMMAVPTTSPETKQQHQEEGEWKMDRAYHNLHHVLELCQLYDQHIKPNFFAKEEEKEEEAVIPQEDVIFLTAFFHDIVYNTKLKDNEEQSAELWMQFAKETNVNENLSSQVNSIILATKNHTQWKPSQEEQTTAVLLNHEIFLDMDMAIVGASPERYREYSSQIRREWSFYPLKDFCGGRIKFLEGVSQAEPSSLFRTKIVRELRAEQTKKNLEWELGALREQLKNLSASSS